MRMRRTALAIALAGGMVVPTVSTAAAAWAKPSAKPAAAQKAAPQQAKPAPSKPAKPVKDTFAASGVVTAVDPAAGTVTVAVKGGTKDVKGHTVSIVVPTNARIVLDDAPASLIDLDPGYRITVTGTRLGTVYTASKVQAKSPEPEVTPAPTEPAEDPAG